MIDDKCYFVMWFLERFIVVELIEKMVFIVFKVKYKEDKLYLELLITWILY